ncbi:hypothetical protein HK097_006759, partial [Rhizophlyctis rosea]
MRDEVEALLEELGVGKGVSEAGKCRAIEGEWQRLKGLGLSDQAAEVQGLYAWKLKQITGSKEGGGGGAGDGLQTAEMEHVLAKLRDAVAVDPDCAEACFHTGRILLSPGNISEASVYLQRALALKPCMSSARILR